MPVIGTSNKIQGRSTLEKGLQTRSPFLIQKFRRVRGYDKFNKFHCANDKAVKLMRGRVSDRIDMIDSV